MKGNLCIATLIAATPTTVFCNDAWLALEGGALFQTRNDVQIPPDTGTRFSLVNPLGKGPLPYVRGEGKYAFNARHRLRLLIAPLTIEKTGRLDNTVVYHGATFLANTDTTIRYQFNSYRLTYAYRVLENAAWAWDVGLTAKVREAEIALTQGTTSSHYPDLGFVPLLHLAAEGRISPRWNLSMDLDASWSPYGRAEDLGVFALYRFNDTWRLGAGYRTVEGGADVDVVYNFAWFHYAGLRLEAHF